MAKSGVNGAKEVQKWLEKVKKEFTEDVKTLVEYRTNQIELGAIRDAPGGGDRVATRYGSTSMPNIARGRSWTPISQSIGMSMTNNGLTGSVYVNNSAGDIAAWIEFGTGQSAASYLSTVEPEWRDLARKYYIDGKGTIIAKPYLYPNYIKQRIEFINDLKKLVNEKR